MAPLGESQQPGFHFRWLLWECQHKILSRASLDRLLNKMNSSSVSNDQKIESFTVCLNSRKLYVFVGDVIYCSEAWQVSEWVSSFLTAHQQIIGMAESLAGVRHQWMVTSSWTHFAAGQLTLFRHTCSLEGWIAMVDTSNRCPYTKEWRPSCAVARDRGSEDCYILVVLFIFLFPSTNFSMSLGRFSRNFAAQRGMSWNSSSPIRVFVRAP